MLASARGHKLRRVRDIETIVLAQSRLGPSSALSGGPIPYLSPVAAVVELHNVGTPLDALQLVEFFIQNVASGADVV